MELQTTPDIYQPVLNKLGDYIDYIPNKNILVNGLYCPCSNKNKSYISLTQFKRHIKTKSHDLWLENLNNNKDNLYIENEKNKRLLNSQKLIINKLEMSINLKEQEINKLINELTIYKKRFYELDELYTKDKALVMLKTENEINEFNNLEKDNNLETLNEIVSKYQYIELPLKDSDSENDFLENDFKDTEFKESRFKESRFKDTEFKDTEFKELTYLLDINN